MSENDDEDYVYCENCEQEIREDEAIYVGGKPYCKNCYRKAEEYETIDDLIEEEDEDDDDYDEDDNDYEDDDYNDDYD
ncbi:MAG: hypothetical protein ACFFDF_14990 [Candidatus Odinarchaeota archaeon]